LQKWFPEAEWHFRKILELAPGNPQARIALGRTLCDQGRCWEGILEYEKIPTPIAQTHPHQVGLGRLDEMLKENLRVSYLIVEEQFKKHIEEEPQNPGWHYSLGVVYAKTERWDEALEKFEKTLELDPGHEYAKFNLGVVKERSKVAK
jgi:tetratricopeptide (TPR) repeat protein